MNTSRLIRNVMLSVLCLTILACAKTTEQGKTSTVIIRQTINELEKEPVPGNEHDVWVDHLYNQVQVPAKLDPEGIYYRPSHKTVVEIMPGKYQKGQYPDINGQYPRPRP